MTQATKQCACCGTINYADAQVCGGCGQYFAVPTATTYCAYCGTPLDSAALFCGGCGNPTHTPAAPLANKPPRSSKGKWWIAGIAIFLSVSLLIGALFHFVINPYLEDLQISSSNGNSDDDDDDGDGSGDGGNNYLGGITGGYIGDRTTQRAATCTTASRTATFRTTTACTANEHSENTQKASAISQIASALTDKGYSVERAYNEEGMGAELRGVSYDYCYYASRYFDEYGNLYAYDQDWGCEYVQIRYIVFESAEEAAAAYQNVLWDNFFDGTYQQRFGYDYARRWHQASAYDSEMGLHTLLSRQSNVLVLVHVNWDDFKDAGLYYDNAAYSVVEGLGF